MKGRRPISNESWVAVPFWPDKVGYTMVALVLLRRAQHILFAILITSGAVRAMLSGHSPPLVLFGSLALTLWYALGMAMAKRTQPAWAPVIWLLVLSLGWVALVAFSVDFVWLAFALFIICMQVLPLRTGLSAVSVLTGAAILASWLHRGQLDPSAVLGPVIGAAIAVVITVVYRDLRNEADTRTRLLAELTAAQQQLAETERKTGALAERDRLAREIHDTVAQSISSIILLLRTARTAYQQAPAAAQHQIDVAESAAQSALDDTRRLIHALSPSELSGHSLPEALQRLAHHACELGQDTSLVIDGEPYPMPTAIDVVLLRMAQEALANVRTHAQASRAVVTLTYLPHAVSLDVADDGRGFDPSRPTTSRTNGTGLGLASMRARLTEVAGTLVIESAPGRGTALSATIPTGDRP